MPGVLTHLPTITSRTAPARVGAPADLALSLAPNFLQILGLDETADGHDIRRAYARRIAQVDRRHDPASVEILRAAYDAALDWHRWHDRQMALEFEEPVEQEAALQQLAQARSQENTASIEAVPVLAPVPGNTPATVTQSPAYHATDTGLKTVVQPAALASTPEALAQEQTPVQAQTLHGATPGLASEDSPAAGARSQYASVPPTQPGESERPPTHGEMPALSGEGAGTVSIVLKKLAQYRVAAAALVLLTWAGVHFSGQQQSLKAVPEAVAPEPQQMTSGRLPRFVLMPMPAALTGWNWQATGSGLPDTSTQPRSLAFLPIVYAPPLDYPADALEKKQQGRVTIKAYVNEAGIVKEATVLRSSGSASLDQAAENAVWQTRYLPLFENDSAVPVTILVRHRFRLPKN